MIVFIEVKMAWLGGHMTKATYDFDWKGTGFWLRLNPSFGGDLQQISLRRATRTAAKQLAQVMISNGSQPWKLTMIDG